MDNGSDDTPWFADQVRIRHEGRLLGTVRVTIAAAPTDAPDSSWAWMGQIVGSDYLMWGLNHKKVTLELPTGDQLTCVVLASGILHGMTSSPPGNDERVAI